MAHIPAGRHRDERREDRDARRHARQIRSDLHVIGQEEDREDREDIGHGGTRQAGLHVRQHIGRISVAVDRDADIDRQDHREEVEAGGGERIAEADHVAEHAADEHRDAVDEQDHQAEADAQRLQLAQFHAWFCRAQFGVRDIHVHRTPPRCDPMSPTPTNLRLFLPICHMAVLPNRLTHGHWRACDNTRLPRLSTPIVPRTRPRRRFTSVCVPTVLAPQHG